eukprot:4919597-Prymnesium_polylepis.2
MPSLRSCVRHQKRHITTLDAVWTQPLTPQSDDKTAANNPRARTCLAQNLQWFVGSTRPPEKGTAASQANIINGKCSTHSSCPPASSLPPHNRPGILKQVVGLVGVANLRRARRVDVAVDPDIAPEHERIARIQLHDLSLATLVKRIDRQLRPILQRHDHDEVGVAPRSARGHMRVWPARVGVQRRLLGRRGVLAAAVDTRLERMRILHLFRTRPRRRREPTEIAFAEPCRDSRIKWHHPLRILAALRLPSVPPIAHTVRTFDGIAVLVKAVVEDAPERRPAHRRHRRQLQWALALE